MNDNQITSRKNPRVQSAARLRQRRDRERQGRILIEGLREVRRAAAAGVQFDEVFHCPKMCDAENLSAILTSTRDGDFPVWNVTPEVFEKLAFGERCDGVVAIARTPNASLANLPNPTTGLVAVLEAVEKPGNLGAVLRSADGAGVQAVIVCGDGTDIFNPTAIRASLGTIFSVPVAAASAEDTLAWLRERTINIAATWPNADRVYTEFDWTAPSAVVLGSEAAGLTAIWSAEDVAPIRIPMLGAADSLNVSATAAVVFYEALRQAAVGKAAG